SGAQRQRNEKEHHLRPQREQRFLLHQSRCCDECDNGSDLVLPPLAGAEEFEHVARASSHYCAPSRIGFSVTRGATPRSSRCRFFSSSSSRRTRASTHRRQPTSPRSARAE